ncbi:MAG: LLM class flavin-dependent oxidoreductase [Dehalococcoidia bacterium]|nr:LLM class flavin-dependent oxidoreductase [Dehalococcoidia bacterium]
MRVGISLTSAYRVEDPREGARWMIERAAAAHGADLDSLFVGDHHSTGPGTYYQNVPIMGRLLAEWGDRPAGVLFLLPLWNPVLVAEQVGTLAAIHQGRFIIQCAIGRDDPQSPAMGVNARFRPSMFEESLGIIRRLLAGETVSSDGRFHLTGAQIAPVALEPVEVWIGGSVSKSIDRAARLGEGWLGDPSLALEAIAAQAAEYHERAQVYGRTPAAVAVRRNVFVGATDEEAARVLEPLLARTTGDRSTMLYGSPETVARHMKSLADIGFTDVIVRSLVSDQRLTIQSIERLAEVRERVRDF